MKNLMRSLSILIMITSLTLQVSGQHRNLESEVLVYIQPGYFELPEGPTNQLKIENIKTVSDEISKIIREKNVVLFSKAFPEFKSSDTISFNSEGNEIKLADVSRIFIFTINEKSNTKDLIEELSNTEGILFAESHSNWQTYDTRYPEQWWLNNTGLYGGTVDADIDAPEAWQITQGSQGVKVGIIDTGVETTHSDLSGKSSGDLPENYYSYGHGTHVAGIVGAKNDGGEVKGVSPNTSIVSKKVFSGVNIYGGAAWAGDEVAYNQIMSAINEGCTILNHSYGGPNSSTTLKLAFANAYKYNRINSVSMGNNNSNSPSYPAAYGQGIVAVGSTDNLDLRSQDNTPGYEWGSNYGNHIDVTAPGGKYAFINDRNILSTWPGNSYLKISGTSMAAPVVAGIASLLKAYNSNLYNDDIEQILKISADDVNFSTYPGWDQYLGTGRVNAYNALRKLQAPYQLSQLSASSGSDYSTSSLYQMAVFGATGLADGMYLVKRHEVRKNVTFPYQYNHYAWGRGVGSNGWSAANPNFGMGFSSVVDGSLSSNQATLSTYVYEVWSISGSWIGWFPTTPQNVSFNYTVLGKPLVAPVIANITQNPVPIYKGTYGYVYCNLAQGNGNLTYNWFSYDQPSYISIVPEGYRCKIIYHATETTTPIEAPGWSFGCTVTNEDVSGWSDSEPFQPSLNPLLYGCPTLAFDNRGTLTSENPLLITSMSNPGKDVTDYYLINTPLTTNNNKINVTIHEPQTEHTWFDNVSLFETRANPDETIVVNDEGQVINYKGVLPARILLNGETDITQNLLELDSLSVELNPGDKLTISRSAVEGDGDVVLGGEEPPPAQKRISAMLMNITRETKLEGKEEIIKESIPIANFFFRPNKSIISKKLRNLPTGIIEITVNKKLTLDYFVFVTDLRTSKTKTLPLLSAVHNINGDIKSKLTGIDQNYAELYPTERIDLSFGAANTTENVKYFLKTVGRYETDTTFFAKQNNLAKINEQPIVPTENKLYDNYPNPFNPSTTIKYSLKNDDRVTLKIFNTLGEEIRTLVDELKPAGNYEAAFNASNLPSGVYIYRMQSGSFVSSKKMILIK